MRLLALTALTFSSQALAEDCASPYTVDGLLGDLSATEKALRDADNPTASQSADRLRAGLGCMAEVLPAMIAARSYRAIGSGLLVSGNEEDAEKWYRTSLELDPVWIYGTQDIPEGHPIRPFFDALKDETGGDYEELEGKSLIEGKHYIDGKKLTKAKARTDRFHIYQVETDSFRSYIIDGNSFPGTVLVSSKADDDAGKKKKGKTKGKVRQPKQPDEKAIAKAKEREQKAKEKKSKTAKAKKQRTKVDADGNVIYLRETPPEKLPLIIGGGAVVVGAGVIYAIALDNANKARAVKGMSTIDPSFDISSRFDLCQKGETEGCTPSPEQEIDRLARTANLLVAVSAGVLAVGVGSLTWGIIVDGDAVGPRISGRW